MVIIISARPRLPLPGIFAENPITSMRCETGDLLIHSSYTRDEVAQVKYTREFHGQFHGKLACCSFCCENVG